MAASSPPALRRRITAKSRSSPAPPIPYAVEEEIMLRLPVKSLLRLQPVSKRWHDVVTKDMRFITEHAERARPRLLLGIRCPVPSFSLTTTEAIGIGTVDSSIDEYVALVFPREDTQLVGSCNGLLCLFFRRDGVVRLLNPAIGESVTLPRTTSSPSKLRFNRHPQHAFGYHPRTKEYTVVYFPDARTFCGWQAYTVGKDRSWRSIQDSIDPSWRPCFFFPQPTTIGGRMYWLASHESPYSNKVACFDLETQSFALLIDSPPELAEDRSPDPFLIETEGQMLSMAVINTHDRVELWDLVEADVWSHRFNVDISALWDPNLQIALLPFPLQRLRISDIAKSGRILLLRREVRWYSYVQNSGDGAGEGGVVNDVSIHDELCRELDIWIYWFDVVTASSIYKETLIPPRSL